MPEAVRIGLRQYIGSVAFDAEGGGVAATSPVGSRLVLWEAGGAGRYLGDLHLPDVCGVAPAEAPGRFVATRGTGAVYRSEENTPELQSLMRIPYAVFCFKKKNRKTPTRTL